MKQIVLDYAPVPEHPFYEEMVGGSLEPIAHRCGNGGEENTREAAEAAVAAGFRYLETDISVTRDGVAVNFHGNRETRADIAATKYAHLNTPYMHEKLGFRGEQIPRFDDMLDEFSDNAHFLVDIKKKAAAEATAHAIRSVAGKKSGAQEMVSIDGAHWGRTLRVLKLLPEYDLSTTIGPLGLVSLYMGIKELPGHKYLKDRYLHGATSLSLPVEAVGEEMISMANKLGMPSFLYRVKTMGQVALAEQYGASGVMVDDITMPIGRLAARRVLERPAAA